MSFLYYCYYYQFWLKGSTTIGKAFRVVLYSLVECLESLACKCLMEPEWRSSCWRHMGAGGHSTVEGAKPNLKHVDRHHSPFDRNFCCPLSKHPDFSYIFEILSDCFNSNFWSSNDFQTLISLSSWYFWWTSWLEWHQIFPVHYMDL